MSHAWTAGILTASSWHGLEEVGTLPDAETMIARASELGAWPTHLVRIPVRVRLEDGTEVVSARDRAVLARYGGDHAPRIVGSVGRRFRELAVAEWRDLVRAAVDAGAKPTGAFALRDGRTVLATFEVDRAEAGAAGAVATQIALVDSFDSTTKVLAGSTSTRIVCANTLAAARRADGEGWAALRHTASLADRVAQLGDAIAETVQTGRKTRELMARAADRQLARDEAEHLLDALFPSAAEGATKTAATRADNERREAARAMRRPENFVGRSLATVWNAATWLVDRHADGTPRALRGGDRLTSMLLGDRGQRVNEIQTIIEVFLRDGSVVQVPASEAQQMGVDPAQVGRAVIADLVGEALS